MTEVTTSGGVLAVTPDQDDWTDDQRTALMFLFGEKQPSRTEARIFLHVCQRVGLDPWAKQVYLVPYKGRWSVQTGIDGFRTIAARTREHEGTVGPWWCGPDGVWVDVWLSDTPPAAARVGTLRSGFREPAFGVVTWKEFGKTGYAAGLWTQMPSHMLAKVAEAHSLRKAFPQDLSGLFTDDEMAQAGEPDGMEHAHGALTHAHPHGERAHDHAELAQPKPAPDYSPDADLARFAPAEDWTVHCGVTGKRRNPKQAAADRLLAAMQAGHPGVSDPRSVIDAEPVDTAADIPSPDIASSQVSGGEERDTPADVPPFAPCLVCGCDHDDGWPGACNVCGCEPCDDTMRFLPGFVPAQTAEGDGTGVALPPLPDSAYPPDATPLDEQADPASEVTLEPTHDDQGDPVLSADPPVVDVTTGEAARTVESVLADIDQAAEILGTNRSKLLIRLALAHRCNPEAIPVDALLAFLDGIMPEVERKINEQGAGA